MSLDRVGGQAVTPVHTLLVLCSTASSMKLITFEDSVRRSRVGALTADGRIVDLNSACALYLRDVENESAFDRLADALVPPNMRELFGGGDTSLEAARKALDYVLEERWSHGPSRRIHLLLIRRSRAQGSDCPEEILWGGWLSERRRHHRT